MEFTVGIMLMAAVVPVMVANAPILWNCRQRAMW